MSMQRSSIGRSLSELFAPRPGPKPDGFDDAAGRLLHARHLAAYDWALPYIAGRDVLEIGVNRGYGSRILAPEAMRFVGVDLSHELASQAHRDTGVNVVQANGQKLPFADQTFDVVVTFQVIEHVWDVHAYLLEISRVLRVGGLLLVSTPQSKGRLHSGQRPWNDEHLREFDEGSWKRTLQAVFGPAMAYGLFAEDVADRIERRRTWQDPWQHFFGGPWAGPIRRLGRMVSGMRKDILDVTPQTLRAVSEGFDDPLLDRFYFDIDPLDAAHDLFAVCCKNSATSQDRGAFDAVEYWQSRVAACPTLQGTGTSRAPVPWQKWIYLGKERAYRRLFKRHGIDLAGKRVLDFGCGTGYFEDVWERWGAARADGIDVVPEAIERLSRAHPQRRYLSGDIAEDAAGLEAFGSVSLLTAIDVLYHIVDDERLVATLRPLIPLIEEHGYFLFTDALHETESGTHVRFRSLHQWKQILAELGMEVVDEEPVFALNNRLIRGVGRLPGVTGMLQHYLDLPVLRTMPWLANNWAVLARRH